MEKLYTHDGETQREFTEAEYKQYEKDKIEMKVLEDERLKNEEKAEADKQALLAKLGISADEAKMLLS
jgi:hypothetical protein